MFRPGRQAGVAGAFSQLVGEFQGRWLTEEPGHHLLEELSCGSGGGTFQPAEPGVFGDVDQGEANQAIERLAGTAIQVIAVFDVVAAFDAAAVLIQGREARGPARNFGEIAQVRLTGHIQAVAHAFVGPAVAATRALLGIKAIARIALFALVGTGIVMSIFGLAVGRMAQAAAAGTEGSAVGIEGELRMAVELGLAGVGCRGALGSGGVFEGDDGSHALDLTVTVDGQGIMVAIADEDVKAQGQVVRLSYKKF